MITGTGSLVSGSAALSGLGTILLPAIGGGGAIISAPSTIGRPLPPAIFYSGDTHIRRSGDDYGDAFLKLLPHGQAWPRHPDSTLVLTCEGLANYWGFVDSRAADLLERESDPRATMELLTDWERNWGLPDPCYNEPLATPDRRKALIARMTLEGGQSRDFFLGVAADMGYHITVSEYAPYMTGVSMVGDTRGPFNPSDPLEYRWQLGPPEMRFYWTVHVYSLRLTYFHCNASMTGIDRLLLIGLATDLECVLRRWKPAHTEIIFDYSPHWALDYTLPFNSMYLALGVP